MKLAEIYEKYKGSECRFGCDKGTVHSYIEVYETLFTPYRTTARSVVEVGIMTGHSLRMWEEYFDAAAVHGVDLSDRPLDGMADLRPMIAEGTHRIALFNASDPAAVEVYFGEEVFDVIVEDAGHQPEEQLAIYHNLKRHLSSDGIYVIEDVENIDRDRVRFEAMETERRVRIIDRRAVKDRFDDVLIVIGGK